MEKIEVIYIHPKKILHGFFGNRRNWSKVIKLSFSGQIKYVNTDLNFLEKRHFLAPSFGPKPFKYCNYWKLLINYN